MNKESHEPGGDNTAFFLSDSYSVISEMTRALDESPEDLITQSTQFVEWASAVSKMGMNVYGISNDSHIAQKLTSPVLDAAQNDEVDKTWISLFHGYKSVAVERNDGFPIIFRGEMAQHLKQLEEFIGVDYEALVNHAPFLYKWAIRKAVSGFLIVSIDNIYEDDRHYNIWGSRYNRRRSDAVESQMIDTVSDALVETITLPILPNNY